MNSFDVAAGLGFEPRLTDPLEPFSFTDRADAEGQGETKQRFYQVLALLEGQGGTGRDTQLRSNCGQKPGALQTDLRAEGRRRLPKHILSAARCI